MNDENWELRFELQEYEQYVNALTEQREDLRKDLYPVWQGLQNVKAALLRTHQHVEDDEGQPIFRALDLSIEAKVARKPMFVLRDRLNANPNLRQWKDINRIIRGIEKQAGMCRKLLVKAERRK